MQKLPLRLGKYLQRTYKLVGLRTMNHIRLACHPDCKEAMFVGIVEDLQSISLSGSFLASFHTASEIPAATGSCGRLRE